MIKQCADRLSSFMVRKKIIDQSHFDIYSYGFECAISSIALAISIAVIAGIMGTLAYSIAFYIGFSIKKLIGGYHAASHFTCIVLSSAIVIAGSLCVAYTPLFLLDYLVPAIGLFACFLIFRKAPILHRNRFKTDEESRKLMLYSRCVALIGGFLTVSVFYLIPPLQRIATGGQFGMGAAAITLLIKNPYEAGNTKRGNL